jgi:hypothetical protein
VAAAGMPLLRKPFSMVELGRALASARRQSSCGGDGGVAPSAR